MRWATGAGVHIDRAACAGPIRRFLDPAAEFVFVGDPAGAAGLNMILRGLSLVRSAEQALAVAGPVFDGLYEFFRRQLLTGREPA